VPFYENTFVIAVKVENNFSSLVQDILKIILFEIGSRTDIRVDLSLIEIKVLITRNKRSACQNACSILYRIAELNDSDRRSTATLNNCVGDNFSC